MWCVVVCSRNLVNEEILVHWGLLRQIKKLVLKAIILTVSGILHYPTALFESVRLAFLSDLLRVCTIGMTLLPWRRVISFPKR